MANLKRAITPERLKNVQITYFTKNHDIFTTPVDFAQIAAMSRPRFETQWSETETRSRLRKTCLKTCLVTNN